MAHGEGRWPWLREPRQPAPELDGDLDGAIAFGLGKDLESLRALTAMLCSGIPHDLGCHPIWSPATAAGYMLSVQQDEVNFSVRFIKTGDELVIHHDAYYLPKDYRQGGNGLRLAKNLAHVCDDLNVAQVMVQAGDTAGSYAWAKFGAKAVDCEHVRARLLTKIERDGEEWGLSIGYVKGLLAHFRNVEDERFMFDIARVEVNGVALGKTILAGEPWLGCWELRNEKIAEIIREALDA